MEPRDFRWRALGDSRMVHSEGAAGWRRALALFGALRRSALEASAISYGVAVGACEQWGAWRQAAALLLELRRGRLEPTSQMCGSAVGACVRSGSRGSGAVAAALLEDMPSTAGLRN